MQRTLYARECRVVAALAESVVEMVCMLFVNGRRKIAELAHQAVHIVLLSSRTKSHIGLVDDVATCRAGVLCRGR